MGETFNKFSHGEPVCDSIFRFYQPNAPVQLEVVFVHGLEHGNCGDAYWKTWVARDGTPDNVWPMTWLPDEFPFAQVFALKYDASIRQTATDGRMDLFLVGETLVQEMVNFGKIGQNGVPVVFVCHGFGGLVAKQIVVSAKLLFSQDNKAQNLLRNIGAFMFYSTPHHGSHLAKSSAYLYNVKGGGKGPLVDNLEVLSTEISRLSQDFEQAKHQTWYIASVAETHVISQYGEMVVEEASSRDGSGNYLALSENHFDICKPRTKKDSSYLWLTKCVREVLARNVVHLPSAMESLVPQSLVRLKEQEQHIKGMLEEVRIVGLVGMGGIGKTTLAKAVYQSICKDFEKSSYLDDVKSKASLDEVLITLLQHFEIKDRKTGCIAQQCDSKESKKALLADLKMYVQKHKVLVVVDDVGTKGNFNCLLEDMGFLSGNKESKLIVTCRDWEVLNEYVPMNGKYLVEYMRPGEDNELFSYHAFKGARTLEQRREVLRGFLSKDSSERLMGDFEGVFDNVVKACGGLPLSLEVMGSCLGGYLKDGDISSMQCLEYWRGALQKLKNAEPLEGEVGDDALWKVFKTSYGVLHENEQNMFLDIACFFCGSVRYGEQTLLRIWGGKPSKANELRNLKEGCLIKINKEDGIVTMHDQLRDMGRSVVNGPSQRVLSQMTRLWDWKDVRKLLQSNKITSTSVQGLSLQGLSLEQLKVFILNCPDLRLLNLQDANNKLIEAISVKGRSSVQWLCLKRDNITTIPKFVWVCMELCVLDMRMCTSLMNIPTLIGKLVNLLEFDLSWCEGLRSLPNSIGNLVNLLEFDLSWCEGLRSLPNSIGNLVNLSKLLLYGCKRLKSLPNSIGDLVNLSELDLSRCEGLTSLPNSIGNLVNLSKLLLSGCKRLKNLPNSIGNFVNLSELDLSRCEGLTCLPDSIGNLVNLSKLLLYGCKRLKSLPNSIGNLVNLSKLLLSWCKGLTSLPHSIGNLVNLSKLLLCGCKRLKSLPNSIGNLVNLLELDRFCCEGLTSLPNSIGNLVNLSKLDLSWCEGLTSLPNSISNLVNLSKLLLCGCKRLKSLPNSIGNLVNLSELDLFGCEGLTSLADSIGNLVNLSKLLLCGCKRLKSLPDSIGNLVNLSELDLFGCEGLTSLADSIGNLVNLSKLRLSKCKGLTSLPHSIGNLVNLSKLLLCGCKRLKSLPDSIGNLVNLSELDLSRCEGLTSLPNSIGNLVNLSKLLLSWCKGLTSLPHSIGNLVNLSKFDLSWCEGLTSLPDSIGNLVHLSEFDLTGCKGVSENGEAHWLSHEAVSELSAETYSYSHVTEPTESPIPKVDVSPQSRFSGVRWKAKKWISEIQSSTGGRKAVWLGTYATEEEAASAYDAGIFYFDKLKNYNFPDSETYLSHLNRNIMDELGQEIFIKAQARRLARKRAELMAKEANLAMRDIGTSRSEELSGLNPFPLPSLKEPAVAVKEWECEDTGVHELTYRARFGWAPGLAKYDKKKVEETGTTLPVASTTLENTKLHVMSDAKEEVADGTSMQEVEVRLNAMDDTNTLLIQNNKPPLMVIVADMFEMDANQEMDENQKMMKALKEEMMKIGCLSPKWSVDTPCLLHEKKKDILCCFNEIDNLFEFYFEDYKSMGDIVGVGFDYAKVNLEEGWQVKVVEISKQDWENTWKNFESTSNTLMVTLYEPQAHVGDEDGPKKNPAFLKKGRPMLWDIAKYFILEATISSLSSGDISSAHANSSIGIRTRSPGTNQETANSSGANVNGNDNNFSQRLVQAVKTIFFGDSSNYWLRKNDEDDPNGDPSNNLDFNAVTTVYLELLPGGCFSDNESIDNESQRLRSQLDNTIHSQIKFTFINEPDNKEIQITVGPVSFQFSKENEKNYMETGRFGWFHNFLDVSFRPDNPDYSKLCTSFKALDVEKGIESYTAATSEANMKGTDKLLSLRGDVSASILTFKLGTDLTLSESNTKSSNVEKTIMRYCEYTKGGFCITQKSDLASSNLRYTCLSPDYMIDLDHGKLSDEIHRNRVDSFPIRTPQEVKFQGTWQPDDVESEPQTLVEYVFEASRVVYMTNMKRANGNVKKSRRFFKSGKRKAGEEINVPLRFDQTQVKTLYLNHAMTHLSGKGYKVRERAKQRPLNQTEHETYLTNHQSLTLPDWPRTLVDVNPEMPPSPADMDLEEA